MKTTLFDEYIEDVKTTGKRVPNRFPTRSAQYRIAIIGEAPGAAEEFHGHPFASQGMPGNPYAGASGRLLDQLLGKAVIDRSACFIGNVVQDRPPGNDIEALAKDGPEFTYGRQQLQIDLAAYKPHLCLLLGKTAFQAAYGPGSLDSVRGTIFFGNEGPFQGLKCLASHHPARCLRQYAWTPILMFDIKKARRHAETPSFTPPHRELIVDWPPERIVEELKHVWRTKPKISVDIEGYVGRMSCISIATSPQRSFIVPFTTRGGQSLWSVEVETQLWYWLIKVLEDPDIHKILQNGLYDRFVLQYAPYHIVVRGVTDDTMLKHWEWQPELEKSLAFMGSVHTDEPYWKEERGAEELKDFWTYCCRDSAVTYEISNKLDRYLNDQQRAHYMFNMQLLSAFLYMELRGIKYDQAAVDAFRPGLDRYLYKLQYRLDEQAGKGIQLPTTREFLLTVAREHMCHKRDVTKPKKDYIDVYPRIEEHIYSGKEIDEAFIGELSTRCKLHLNTKGPALKELLYDKLGLPRQYDPKSKALTTDVDALWAILKKTDHPIVHTAIELSALRMRAQMLDIGGDEDGRIRALVNIVGAATGRATYSKSPTGSGYNLQTIPDKNLSKPEDHPLRGGMRHFFTCDSEEFYLFQCDLAGADGWTVAAWLNALGEPTMLLDLLAGIKPARNLCLMLRHGPSVLDGRSRPEIKEMGKEVKKDDWDYFACKIGQHGTCYLMGPDLLADKIYVESEGKIKLSRGDTRNMQQLFMIRYRLPAWHNHVGRKLRERPEIVSASGNKRRFFGRPREILGPALAHEPQNNTTYAINRAILKLWMDPENRTERGFRIEQLLQIHDAVVGQFRRTDLEWARPKIRAAFSEPIFIARQAIVIPFEGRYGTNWEDLEHEL